MDQSEFDVIERVLAETDLPAEHVLAAALRAMVDAYQPALARDPNAHLRCPDEWDDPYAGKHALDHLTAVAMTQQCANATLSDQHERDAAAAAARGGLDALRSRMLAKSYENLALAQSALMDLLDGCYDLALRKAGLPPVFDRTPSPVTDDDDQPRLRLAV